MPPNIAARVAKAVKLLGIAYWVTPDMVENRADSANSAGSISGGYVLWKPKMAEKRRTGEQTKKQKLSERPGPPYLSLPRKSDSTGISLYGQRPSYGPTHCCPN